MSRPESPTRPERRVRTGARFTPTFSFILSKHLFMSFRFKVFNYAEAFSNGRPINLYISQNAITMKAFYAFLKWYTKQNINSEFNDFVHKISHVQKEMICKWRGIYLYTVTCSMTLRFTILSSFPSTRNLRIDKTT